MPDMGLPLAYGAGTAQDTLEQLLKERLLIQEQQRRQAELEWQKQYQGGMLGLAQNRDTREGTLFNTELPGVQADTNVKVQTAPQRIQAAGLDVRGKELDVQDKELDLTDKQRLFAARKPEYYDVEAAPTPWQKFMPAFGGASPFAREGQQDMDIEKERTRRAYGVANIGATARQGQLSRGQIRTVPNAVSDGSFGVPAGTPVTAVVVVGADEKGTPTAERISEIPTGMSAGQKEQATALESVADLFSQARTLWQAHKGTTGPVMGRLEKVAGRVGTNIDPVRAQIGALLQSAKNRAIYALSGKQINETEYLRLMDEMPDITQDDATFELRLNNAENAIQTPLSRLGRLGTGPVVTGQATGGPQIGEQRIVNGQLATWDGNGWVVP